MVKSQALRFVPSLKTLVLVPCLDQRLLNQVVCLVGILGERHGEGAQAGNRGEEFRLNCAVTAIASILVVRWLTFSS